MTSKLEFIRLGGEVERFHSIRTIKGETVGQHSFGVAWFCYLLSDPDLGQPSSYLLLSALAHDLAEQTVGDIPSPAHAALGISEQLHKYETGILERAGLSFPLSDEEAATLRLADCLDGLMFCVRERVLGNRNLSEVFFNYLNYSKKIAETHKARNLLSDIYQLWKEANE